MTTQEYRMIQQDLDRLIENINNSICVAQNTPKLRKRQF